MKSGFIILIILIGALVVSGCSSTNMPTSVPTPAPTPAYTQMPTTPEPTPQTGTLAQNVTTNISDKNLGHTSYTTDITIQGFAFHPDTITISAGDTVKWTNLDSVNHDVKGDTFDSGVMKSDGTFEMIFNQTGTYNYICSIHSSMKGQIIVQ